MKRLGIFCFYDKEGRVDTYVDYLLGELRTVIDKLIIVVNGQIDEADRNILLKHTDNVIIRSNRGYDVGAYLDVLKQTSDIDWDEWDELVLCNDTFYGPFISMKVIFCAMDSKDCDFWGLNILERGLLSHIQSYFFVFRKKVLSNKDLFEYLYKNVNTEEEDITNIYGLFEPGLFMYLAEKGYKYGAYVNTELCDIYRSAQMCIEKYGLPILKKKFFFKNNVSMESKIAVIQYLYHNTNYDVRYILRNLSRLGDFRWKLEEILDYKVVRTDKEIKVAKSKYTKEKLLELIRDREFYLYGEGILARELFLLYFSAEKLFRGFIISDKQVREKELLYGHPVYFYSEIPQNELIVLGVNAELAQHINEQIGKEQQVIELWYDRD